MSLHSRWQFLTGAVGIGTMSISGCLSGRSTNGSCSDGRFQYSSDVSLDGTEAWPMYRYDAANSGYNPDAQGPKTGVETAWRYSACSEADSRIAVSDGRVYAGGAVFDGRTGERIRGEWFESSGSPSVVDGTVYVTGNGLEARSAATGDERWAFRPNRGGGILSAPTVAADTVYVPGSNTVLYGIDAATGDERWRFETEGRIETTPAVSDGTVYAVDKTNTLYAISAETGEKRWRANQDVDCWRSAPAVANDRLFLGSCDRTVRAVDTADGSTVWQQTNEIDVPIRRPIAATEMTVFAAGDDGTVVALDAATGRLEWRQTVDAYELGAPVVADEVVYVGEPSRGPSGKLFALDVGDGTVRWQFATRAVDFGDYTRAGITHGPVVFDGVVYASTAPGDLYALLEHQ
ncbi:PQQ-binding-like beta-propeller repeat protein [Natrinema sp. 74]|uniref:outer membrane protein assembly factor BamB family protein n=1 Tax=Natrinema sp. 74 TaxID=3384159 RepID=UPI0038D44692